MIRFIPNGMSTKNFYDHKEIAGFLQGKKGLSTVKIEINNNGD